METQDSLPEKWTNSVCQMGFWVLSQHTFSERAVSWILLMEAAASLFVIERIVQEVLSFGAGFCLCARAWLVSLAAQVQQFCKLAASASAETSRAALSQTSQVSTAAAALKLGCFSHRSAHEQDVLAVVQLP